MKLEGRIIYDDGRTQISQSEFPNEHHILVDGDAYCFLGRGILNEWTRANSERIESGLNAMNKLFLIQLKEKKISLDYIGWAISKARINELEEEIEHFASEYVPK